MTDYSYPGVYIKEVSAGPGPITGVSTSNLGLTGWSPKGVVNEPILSTSFPEYVSNFGTFNDAGISAHEAYAFFANGGQRLYFVRVAPSDAIDAYWDLSKTLDVAEDLGSTAEASGIYSLELGSIPVTAGSLSALVFENAGTPANVNVFEDDGTGTLVLDVAASGASAAGGSGVIDPETGEISITLNDPSQFTGGSDSITALYSYSVFQFKMKWPGLAGDNYRVRITPGSDDYLVQAEARWTRFTVSVDEDVNADSTNRSWVVRETFSDLSFDTASDPNYLVTVINADGSGSNLIEVVDYGNGMNPAALQGTAVVAEDFSATQEHADGSSTTVPDPYDGSWVGWKYVTANGVFENTFAASFKFNDGVEAASGADDSGGSGAAILTDSTASWTVNAFVGYTVFNDTDGSSAVITANSATTVTGTLVGGTNDDWDDADAYRIVRPNVKIGIAATPTAAVADVISQGSVAAPAKIVAGSVVIKATLASAGVVNIVDKGDGTLWDGVAGSAGTIDYTTGAITSNQLDVSGVTAWTADTFVAGSEILWSCQYDVAVVVEDDADGNLALAATQATGYPQKFGLNAAGTNAIDYDTGEFTLYWKIAGEPSAGPAAVSEQTASYYTQPASEIEGQMAGGSDGTTVTSSDIIDPSLAVDEEGLYAFGKVSELMQIVAADFQTDTVVADALITYAELMKDKFALLTVPYGLTYQEAVNWKKFQLNKFSSYAAIYYPHIKINDPVTNTNLDIPCGGHLAGIYARTDSEENVGTAPAGMGKGDINWSTGLEVDLTEGQVGFLNENRINALVQWPHTGRVVWGARTIDAAGGEWPYIQMRRLFMFVEKSVFNSTHIHVFKNNNASLWSAIRTQVSSFLETLHDAGYFAGETADESFFVICDRTNNPQNTVDQGIVFCDVGLAPNNPAEFIVFRFSQKSL